MPPNGGFFFWCLEDLIMTPIEIRAIRRAQTTLQKQWREKTRDQQQNLSSAEA